jgi:hypothetical protein
MVDDDVYVSLLAGLLSFLLNYIQMYTAMNRVVDILGPRFHSFIVVDVVVSCLRSF